MTSIDWNKLNQKVNQLTEKLNKKTGSSAKFWRPNAGDNRIRILPGWAEEGDYAGQFWREVAQHWGVSEEQAGPVVCPKQTPYLEGDCPICDFVEALKQDKGDVRAQELVKQLRAKTAYLLNVVDMKDPTYTAADVAEYKKNRPEGDVPFQVGDTKVQVFAAPATVFNQILNSIQVNQVDITDPTSGHDINIRKDGKGLTTKYTVGLQLKASAAPACSPIELDQVGRVLSTDKLMELLVSGAGGEYTAMLPSSTRATSAAAQSADIEDALGDADDIAADLASAFGD